MAEWSHADSARLDDRKMTSPITTTSYQFG
jgi:hypothetical protein